MYSTDWRRKGRARVREFESTVKDHIVILTKSVATADVQKPGKYSCRSPVTGWLLRIIPLNYAFFHKHTHFHTASPSDSSRMREEPTRADFRLRDTQPSLMSRPRPEILIQFCANAAFKSLMKFRNNFILAI